MANVRQELIIQSLNATPPTSGVILWLMGITLNQVFTSVSIGLLLLQGAYLIWKWRKEAKNAQNNVAG